ncbi:hypothetical protein VNO77_27507 [Canavalia gladiata]|uniref:Uncharacterized protein n=1 Tax=Canavalia gladiata TaxID=3824 RepID=A0AAN9Q6J0_CANGL
MDHSKIPKDTSQKINGETCQASLEIIVKAIWGFSGGVPHYLSKMSPSSCLQAAKACEISYYSMVGMHMMSSCVLLKRATMVVSELNISDEAILRDLEKSCKEMIWKISAYNDSKAEEVKNTDQRAGVPLMLLPAQYLVHICGLEGFTPCLIQYTLRIAFQLLHLSLSISQLIDHHSAGMHELEALLCIKVVKGELGTWCLNCLNPHQIMAANQSNRNFKPTPDFVCKVMDVCMKKCSWLESQGVFLLNRNIRVSFRSYSPTGSTYSQLLNPFAKVERVAIKR